MNTPTAAIKTLRDQNPTLLVGIDDEGGLVNRLKTIQPNDLPSQQEMAKKTDAEITALIGKRATYLRSLGITTNFAPVIDLLPANGKPVPGGLEPSRMFGGDAARVAHLALLYASAMKDSGINPVYKHFPGIGSASGHTDTAKGPVAGLPLKELQKRDLLPYDTLDKADPRSGIMVSSVTVAGLTDGKPVATSPAAYQLLKGFGGPIFTDDLGSRTFATPVSQNIIDALEAGATMPLFVETESDAVKASIKSQLDAIIARAKQAAKTDMAFSPVVDQAIVRNVTSIGQSVCSIVKP